LLRHDASSLGFQERNGIITFQRCLTFTIPNLIIDPIKARFEPERFVHRASSGAFNRFREMLEFLLRILRREFTSHVEGKREMGNGSFDFRSGPQTRLVS
jgi:hypothetical protein